MLNLASTKTMTDAPFRQRNRELACALYEQFSQQFFTREDCLEELFRIWHIEKRCNNCNSEELAIVEAGRAGKCLQCRQTTWFTAGTALEHMRDPVARLAALLLTHAGVVLNSVLFSRLLHISQSSAHGILIWLRITALPSLAENSTLVQSAHFSSVFCKRSRETPAGEHPVSEQAAMEEKYPEEQFGYSRDENACDPKTAISMNDNSDSSHEEIELQLILDLISDKPVSFDTLSEQSTMETGSLSARLMMLELNDKIKRSAGDWYVRLSPRPKLAAPNQMTAAAIADFLCFIGNFFGGISRRYLQPYLAAYWLHKRTSSEIAPDWSVLRIQNFQQMMRFDDIKNFVTPLWVNLAF